MTALLFSRALAALLAFSFLALAPCLWNPVWAADNPRALSVSPALTVAEVMKALQPDLDKVAPSVALGRASTRS